MHKLTSRHTSRSSRGFLSAAVLTSSIMSCGLKKEPPMKFADPECSDPTMTIEQIDACHAALERLPPLYTVTERQVVTVTEVDSGAPVQVKVELAPGCLENMSRVGPFCIDQYENYVVEIKDGNETTHPFNALLSDSGNYVAKCEKGVLPQGYITGEQAEAACKNAGKRLCTLQEWRSACVGSKGYLYSYRADRPDNTENKCNTRRIWQPGVLFGRGNFDLNDPRLNTLPGGLAKTGENPECTSDHKVFDMLGNLHEWVSTRVDASMIFGGGRTNVPGLYEMPGNGIFAGGFYTNDPSCNYATKSHPFSHHDYSTGFRCCMDPRK